jgi:hypothetical protein
MPDSNCAIRSERAQTSLCNLSTRQQIESSILYTGDIPQLCLEYSEPYPTNNLRLNELCQLLPNGSDLCGAGRLCRPVTVCPRHASCDPTQLSKELRCVQLCCTGLGRVAGPDRCAARFQREVSDAKKSRWSRRNLPPAVVRNLTSNTPPPPCAVASCQAIPQVICKSLCYPPTRPALSQGGCCGAQLGSAPAAKTMRKQMRNGERRMVCSLNAQWGILWRLVWWRGTEDLHRSLQLDMYIV